MLAKKQRLTRTEFDHYFKQGKRVHSTYMQIIYAPGDTFHGAVVVGKKVYKRAADRNQLRRRLYGTLYRFGARRGHSGVFIIITKPPIKELTRKQILTETEAILERLPL